MFVAISHKGPAECLKIAMEFMGNDKYRVGALMRMNGTWRITITEKLEKKNGQIV